MSAPRDGHAESALSQQWGERLEAIAQAPGFPQLLAAQALANAYLRRLAAAQVITATEEVQLDAALMAAVRAAVGLPH